jgi:hypothetical protein
MSNILNKIFNRNRNKDHDYKLHVYDITNGSRKYVGDISLKDNELTYLPSVHSLEPYRNIIQPFLNELKNSIFLEHENRSPTHNKTISYCGKLVSRGKPDLYLTGVAQKLKDQPIHGKKFCAELE